MKEVKLSVVGAKEQDVGRGIVRISETHMEQMGIQTGDWIEISGKRTTVGIAWPAHREDENRDIIRIDGFTKKNAGLGEGEKALIRLAEVENGEKVILAPIDMRLNVDEDFADFVKKRLDHHVLREGDITLVKMLGHAIPFNVVSTLPQNVTLEVIKSTILTIMGRPYPPPELDIKTTTDIRFLLRFDWLNSLVARIKGSSIVFSILGQEVSDVDETEVLDTAFRIAYDTNSNVRIEVDVKSNGTTIGSLPWVEVNANGKVSAVYPNIPFPPSTSAFVPQIVHEKSITQMKRCFKTGVKHCPKEIRFFPKRIVVAMPFQSEFQDTYKYAIKPAFKDADFETWKADEQLSNIDVMCKICQAIQESGYLLADITTWNTNVVFELGLAYGLGRNVILIKKKKAEVPVNLKGIEYIEYGTIDELKRNLLLILKSITIGM